MHVSDSPNLYSLVIVVISDVTVTHGTSVTALHLYCPPSSLARGVICIVSLQPKS